MGNNIQHYYFYNCCEPNHTKTT